MGTLETSLVIFIVGEEDKASLKVAVIVTTSEPDTKLSESVSVKLDKFGDTLSKRKVVVDTVFKFPARSSTVFSFKVSVTIPEKDNVFVAVMLPEKAL